MEKYKEKYQQCLVEKKKNRAEKKKKKEENIIWNYAFHFYT